MTTPPIIYADGAPTQPTGFAVVAAGHRGLEQRAEHLVADAFRLVDDLRERVAPDDAPIADAALETVSFLSAHLQTLVVRSRKRSTTIRPRPVGSQR